MLQTGDWLWPKTILFVSTDVDFTKRQSAPENYSLKVRQDISGRHRDIDRMTVKEKKWQTLISVH